MAPTAAIRLGIGCGWFRGVLADADVGASHLVRHTIDLPRQPVRYVRLSWPPGEHGVLLSRVWAEFARDGVAEHRLWERAVLRSRGAHGSTYEFDSGGRMPVDRVEVVLARRGFAVPIELSSRAGPGQPWLLRFRGLLYDLTVAGVPLASPAIRLPPTPDRLWRVHIGRGDAASGPLSTPVLEFGWVPQQLLFRARGEAPFTLAYGAWGVGPRTSSAGALRAERGGLIKVAPLGGHAELGGASRLKPPGTGALGVRVTELLGLAIVTSLALEWWRRRRRGALEERGRV